MQSCKNYSKFAEFIKKNDNSNASQDNQRFGQCDQSIKGGRILRVVEDKKNDKEDKCEEVDKAEDRANELMVEN